MQVGFIGLGSQGGPMARPDRRSRLPDDAVGAPAATLEPFADTAAQGRRFAGRTRRGQRPGLPVRGR